MEHRAKVIQKIQALGTVWTLEQLQEMPDVRLIRVYLRAAGDRRELGGLNPQKAQRMLQQISGLPLVEKEVKPPKRTRRQKARAKRRAASMKFLKSWDWTTLRYKILKKYGARCMLCGATPESGAVIQVDHIRPRHTHPHLALDPDNLQVLCADCNQGKGAWDRADHRPDEEAEQLPDGAEGHMADIVRH